MMEQGGNKQGGAAEMVISEHRIASAQGEVYACRWQPAQADTQAETQASNEVPIVLLHDSLGSVELWRDFPAALCVATGRVVIAYDRAGFGRSAVRVDPLAADFITREAQQGFAAVREHFALEQFILFGHSVGGGMAVHCAAQWPQHCVALITESAQAFVEDRTVAGIEEARELFADPAQRERLARYHGERTDWVLNAWIGSWLAPSFADWSLRAVLPQVRCPLLAIHGEEDEYGSPAHPELIVALAGGATQCAVLPGVRHVPHREASGQVLTLVTDFLQACSSAPFHAGNALTV
jgi:pimeloyl-ACP methyl ester carboxylesterase